MGPHSIIPINVDNLLINNENPRHDPVENEKEAIITLLEELNYKMVKLAADIVDKGLNPSENIIISSITDLPNYYVVKEGNRRVTILKLLKNIKKYTYIPYYSKFLKLSDAISNNNFFYVNCVIIEDKQLANHWIALKHTGENSGIGIVSWNTESQERFKELTGQKPSIGYFTVKYFYENFPDFFPNRKIPITTINRILTSKKGQSYFKIFLEKDTLCFKDDKKVTINKLTRLFELVLDKTINSRNINKKEDIENILDTYFSDDLIPDITSITQVSIFDHGQAEDNPSSSNENNINPMKQIKRSTKKHSTKDSDITPSKPTSIVNPTSRIKQIPSTIKRHSVIPSHFKVRTTETKINNLIYELKKLNVNDFTNAASISLRVLIELAIDYYGNMHNCFEKLHNPTLSAKIKRIRDYLYNIGYSNEDLVPFDKVLGDPDSIYSTNTFNKYVHHKKFQAGPMDLKLSWDNIEEYMKFFLTNQ